MKTALLLPLLVLGCAGAPEVGPEHPGDAIPRVLAQLEEEWRGRGRIEADAFVVDPDGGVTGTECDCRVLWYAAGFDDMDRAMAHRMREKVGLTAYIDVGYLVSDGHPFHENPYGSDRLVEIFFETLGGEQDEAVLEAAYEEVFSARREPPSSVLVVSYEEPGGHAVQLLVPLLTDEAGERSLGEPVWTECEPVLFTSEEPASS
jgi:hypothetical protein